MLHTIGAGGSGGGGGTVDIFVAGVLLGNNGADVTTTCPPLVGIVKATVTMPAEAAAACNTSLWPLADISSTRGGV